MHFHIEQPPSNYYIKLIGHFEQLCLEKAVTNLCTLSSQL